MAADFPTGAVNPAGADLTVPLKELLQGLSMLPLNAGKDEKNLAWAFTGTPQSVSVLEAGATALAKGWTVLLGLLGGGTAVAAGVTRFWQGEEGATRVAMVVGASGILIATVIAIAWMVVNDVRCRATAGIELYEARKSIARRFMELTVQSAKFEQPPTITSANLALVALALDGRRAPVHGSDGTDGVLSGIDQRDDGSITMRYTTPQGTRWVALGDLRLVKQTY
jgi:hypothetical protein